MGEREATIEWGGTIAVVTLYISAAAAVRHGGWSLPSWPMAVAKAPAVAHDGRLSRAHRQATRLAHRWR
jgi:hypothetical protein